MKWPWKSRTEDAVRELRKAQQAREEVRHQLAPKVDHTVGRVYRLKHENHLGETFNQAFGIGGTP